MMKIVPSYQAGDDSTRALKAIVRVGLFPFKPPKRRGFVPFEVPDHNDDVFWARPLDLKGLIRCCIAPSNVDLTLRPLKHRSVLGNFQPGERLERPGGLRQDCQAADTEHVRSIGQVAKKCLACALEEKGHASCRDHGWTTDGYRSRSTCPSGIFSPRARSR